MKIRKLSKCLIIFLFPLLLVGCFNYNDINKVTFATSIIFDTDDFGNAVVYLDCIKPYRSTNESSDKGRRIIYKGVGKTALEALRDVNLASSFEINYSQNRAYIFTEKAAKKGVKKYLDLINNDQQFQVKPGMFAYYGDVEELLKITSSDEEYLGLYLEELFYRNQRNSRAMRANINDYLSNSLMSDNTYIIGIIEIRKDALDKKIEINGGAILKDDILVERINATDALNYNIMMDNIKSGILELPNPQYSDSFISLEILENKTISNLEYKDGRIKLIKNVDMRVSIAEAQGELIVDNELLKYIKETKEKELELQLKYIFNKYKEDSLDVFEIQRLLEIHYPKVKIDNPILKTDLDIKVNIMIDGTGIVKDSL